MSKPTHRVAKRRTYIATEGGKCISYPSGSPCTPDADALKMTPEKFELIEEPPKVSKKAKKEAEPDGEAAKIYRAIARQVHECFCA